MALNLMTKKVNEYATFQEVDGITIHVILNYENKVAISKDQI